MKFVIDSKQTFFSFVITHMPLDGSFFNFNLLKMIYQITGSEIMVDRDEIRDRLETNLPFCRLPRALAVVQRRRADIIKQWSIDDTQSWFYSRSESLDRHHQRPGFFSEEPSEKACLKFPNL